MPGLMNEGRHVSGLRIPAMAGGNPELKKSHFEILCCDLLRVSRIGL